MTKKIHHSQAVLIAGIFMATAAEVSAGAKAGQKTAHKGSCIYVEALDKGEYLHIAHAIDYRNYWKLVDRADAADFILRVKTIPGWNYRAFAVLEDAHSHQVVYTTRKVNTLWAWTFNMKKEAMTKLVKKRLHRDFISKQDT